MHHENPLIRQIKVQTAYFVPLHSFAKDRQYRPRGFPIIACSYGGRQRSAISCCMQGKWC